MGEPWYKDFMSSTGFGPKQSTLSQPPAAPQAQRKEQEFIANYKGPQGQLPQDIPGTRSDGLVMLPGEMRAAPAHSKPFSTHLAVGNSNGAKVQPIGVEQKHWQATGVGASMPDVEKTPAVQVVPGAPKTRGLVVEHSKDTTQPQENMSATQDKTLKTTYAAGAIFFGVVAAVSGVKYSATERMPSDRSWAMVAIVSLILAGVGTTLYVVENNKCNSSAGPEGQHGEAVMRVTDGMKVRGSRDTDVKVHRPLDDSPNSIRRRLQEQGTDFNTLEGPRAGYGYQRAGMTPNGTHKQITGKDLMRTAAMSNMDEKTFAEYMRRMGGEAPDQFVQRHPYYTFNAEWDNRPQINDPSTMHGIGTAPNQMQRDALYKDPRIQQAGAKTMHLKNPPPGSDHKLGKTHPWLEKNHNGEAPSFPIPDSGERQVAAPEQIAYQDDAEDNTAQFANLRQMENERAASIQKNAEVSQEFLKPVETVTGKKRNIMNHTETPQEESRDVDQRVKDNVLDKPTT